MSLPNFLVIGAAKAGTTSLYYYLKQHPEIFLPFQKELKFFAFEGETFGNAINNIEDYKEQFRDTKAETAIGEISPVYLCLASKSAPKIKHYLPDVKLIAILRNPVERAYSHFLFRASKSLNAEPLQDFKQAIMEEERRLKEGYSYHFMYKNTGYYYQHLKHYFDLFPKEQIKIYLYEDFTQNTNLVLQDIFRFLNVNDNFLPDTSVKKKCYSRY